jgi:hypothetical protein
MKKPTLAVARKTVANFHWEVKIVEYEGSSEFCVDHWHTIGFSSAFTFEDLQRWLPSMSLVDVTSFYI